LNVLIAGPALLLKWLSKVVAARAVARNDAAVLLRDHGEDAFRLARTRAREARLGKTIDADRDARHWDRVIRMISRQRPPSGPDTATRMLDDRL